MLPDFIVIGAAKAGTTALYWYLAEHPDVFMSTVKETNYFAYAADGTGRPAYGDPRLHRFPVRSLEAYEQLFASAGGAKAVGEASPIYLECPSSAARIRAAIPDARIICGLRDPVDRAYSDYLMYLRYQGIPFDAERDLNPAAAWAQPDSHWMRVSFYHDALLRYFEAFPRERIHLFLFDDLKRDARGVARRVFRFLDVDPRFEPDTATPYNTGGLPSNRLIERFFSTAATVRSTVEPWLPRRAAKWLRRVRAANLQRAPGLPEALRAELIGHFHEDIHRTAELTGLNLDAWLQPARPPAPGDRSVQAALDAGVRMTGSHR